MSKLNDIEVFAKEAALNALRSFRKEQIEHKKKAIIHNTESLLINFLEIQYFFQNCKDTVTQGEIKVLVKSLKNARMATVLLYHHSQRCFDRLKEQEPEKFKVLEMLYLDESLQKVKWENRIFQCEEKLFLSRATIYRVKSEMVSKLSIMLFGADGYILTTI